MRLNLGKGNIYKLMSANEMPEVNWILVLSSGHKATCQDLDVIKSEIFDVYTQNAK